MSQTLIISFLEAPQQVQFTYLSSFLVIFKEKVQTNVLKFAGSPHLLSVPTCLTPTNSHWVWWLTPAFLRLRPEAHCKFKASMGHVVKFQVSLGNSISPCLIKLFLIPKQKPTTTIPPHKGDGAMAPRLRASVQVPAPRKCSERPVTPRYLLRRLWPLWTCTNLKRGKETSTKQNPPKVHRTKFVLLTVHPDPCIFLPVPFCLYSCSTTFSVHS